MFQRLAVGNVLAAAAILFKKNQLTDGQSVPFQQKMISLQLERAPVVSSVLILEPHSLYTN